MICKREKKMINAHFLNVIKIVGVDSVDLTINLAYAANNSYRYKNKIAVIN